MIQEKSCGAVVYRKHKSKTQILLIKHVKGGHWSFPKGHVEQGEKEEETALREIKEETGLDVFLEKGFRHTVQYCPTKFVSKEVVYFLAKAKHNHVKMQEEEICDIKWVNFERCFHFVTYENDIFLLEQSNIYFTQHLI